MATATAQQTVTAYTLELSEASPADVRLVTDHADSLNWYLSR